jgi:hypothetical protein
MHRNRVEYLAGLVERARAELIHLRRLIATHKAVAVAPGPDGEQAAYTAILAGSGELLEGLNLLEQSVRGLADDAGELLPER